MNTNRRDEIGRRVGDLKPVTPRVFVTQQPRPNHRGFTPDLSPATQFGSINYVFDSEDRAYSATRTAMKKAEKELSTFNPDRDFLCWPYTGDPMTLAICSITLTKMGMKYFKMLYWERRRVSGQRLKSEGFYTPVTVYL